MLQYVQCSVYSVCICSYPMIPGKATSGMQQQQAAAAMAPSQSSSNPSNASGLRLQSGAKSIEGSGGGGAREAAMAEEGGGGKSNLLTVHKGQGGRVVGGGDFVFE